MKQKRPIDKFLLRRIAGLPCAACGGGGTVAHHIKSRGAGGGDVLYNVVPMCASCHYRIHLMGAVTFTRTHKNFEIYISRLGWVLDSDGLSMTTALVETTVQ